MSGVCILVILRVKQPCFDPHLIIGPDLDFSGWQTRAVVVLQVGLVPTLVSGGCVRPPVSGSEFNLLVKNLLLRMILRRGAQERVLPPVG